MKPIDYLSNDSSTKGPPPTERLQKLVESYLARFRKGEKPSITEYISENPELEAEIREFFPLLLLIDR